MTDTEMHDTISPMDEDGSGCVDVEEFVEWWTHPSNLAARNRSFGKLREIVTLELQEEAMAVPSWDASELQELLSGGTVSNALDHVRGLGMRTGKARKKRVQSFVRMHGLRVGVSRNLVKVPIAE
jgi:hypothetical protein